jgi:4'-phosphopantetheinyl transferase
MTQGAATTAVQTMADIVPDQATINWFAAGMQHVAADGSWLEPALAERLVAMPYTKRREEARLGRWTAKVTIARALGMEPNLATLRQIVIRNAPDGAPEAIVNGEPLNAVIAMTDRADWAVCSIIPGSERLGCDLELIEPRSAAFVQGYFTATEQARVAAADDPDLVANLIWSAKESALKVMRTGLRRDTRSVVVELLDSGEGEWLKLEVTADDGRRFPGWWIRFGSFVLTVAAAVPTAPPVSLVHPEPLRSACPGHTWMADPYSPSR